MVNLNSNPDHMLNIPNSNKLFQLLIEMSGGNAAGADPVISFSVLAQRYTAIPIHHHHQHCLRHHWSNLKILNKRVTVLFVCTFPFSDGLASKI